MKKIIAVILVFAMTFSLIGCGEAKPNKDDNTDTNTSTNDDGKDTDVKYQTYFEVVYSEGLVGAYKYFNENFDDLDEDLKKEYVDELNKETLKRATSYKMIEEYVGVESQAPKTIQNINAFYPNVFDAEEYSFNINTLNDDMKSTVEELKDDDIFALCKVYWNTEGYIEDMGFAAVMQKEIAEIIDNRFDNDKKDILEYVNVYTDHISGMDNKFESDAKYPIVLVENTEKFNLFEGMNKILLYVPIKIIDELVADDNSDSSNTGDNSSSDSDENKSTDENDNTAKEELPINMVIKDYDGVGLETLTSVDYDYKYSEDFKDEKITKINKNLAVFGKIYDVEIGRIKLYTEGIKEELKTYDELSDSVINLIDCPINENDMSPYMMYISFYDEDLNQYTFGFSSDLEENQLPYCEISKQELKSGAPNKVAFNSGEKAIINSVDGSNDDFTAIYLVDEFEDFANDKIALMYYPCDSRAKYNMEEEIPTTIIPLFVSSNMYEVQIEYSNYGEVIENSSEHKNIKAGTWVIFDAVLQGDGEAYKVKFKLKDGTEKEIYIGTDESDEAVLINGNVVNIK